MNTLLKLERYVPTSYVMDAHVTLFVLRDHARNVWLLIVNVLHLTRRETAQRHAAARDVVRWPELVCHYVVAVALSLASRESAERSALGYVPRFVVATVLLGVLVWANVT